MFLNNFKKYHNTFLKSNAFNTQLRKYFSKNCERVTCIPTVCFHNLARENRRCKPQAAAQFSTSKGFLHRDDVIMNNPVVIDIEKDDMDYELSNDGLYNIKDELIMKMSECKSPKELLELTETRFQDMEAQHFVQNILLLWNYFRKDPHLKHDPSFEKICNTSLNNLPNFLHHLNPNELCCSYLYLRKLGIANSHTAMQKLLLKALEHIKKSAIVIPLTALSRLAVAINIDREFFVPLACQNFIPHILKHIEQFETDEDARLLAICLFHLHQLIDMETLNNYKNRVQWMLDEGIISENNPKSVLKILNTLNFYIWSQNNTILIRNLMYTMRKSIDKLDENDLTNLCRIFQYHYEPAGIGCKLKKSVESLQNSLTPDTLACSVFYSGPQKREHLIKEFKKMLFNEESWKTENACGYYFIILRSLKISDINICDHYWENILKEVKKPKKADIDLKFLRYANRYMNFNNNLGGTYRYLPLERQLSELSLLAIQNDLSGRIPTKFARLAAFILAYGHTSQSQKRFPNIVLSKIINFSEQFTIADCFILSRGLQIAQELRFRYYIPTLLKLQLSTIDNILLTCAERHLRTDKKLSANDLNAIVRSLSNRKSLRNTVVFQEAYNRYKQLTFEDLCSRSIRDMSYNFIATNFIVPETIELMFEYIKNNYDHIMGETVEKVLTCSYNIGYMPKTSECLLYAGEIILRDFHSMSGLSILQSALALCFYKAIPENLINEIFCVKFIQRIEDEIQMCYSKATYPERVLNVVMQLNRTVCLDFPETNVPWFQQNYIEAQLTKKPLINNQFSEDIRKLLTTILKDAKYFRCNHTTPYGYQIDFVIHFDRSKKPLVAPVETTMLDRITKVAILLLKLDSFCENDITQLRGPESLKMKHLEMMGYKVIHINEHDWNSKYLNTPGAQANYLKCLLQISN